MKNLKALTASIIALSLAGCATEDPIEGKEKIKEPVAETAPKSDESAKKPEAKEVPSELIAIEELTGANNEMLSTPMVQIVRVEKQPDRGPQSFEPVLKLDKSSMSSETYQVTASHLNARSGPSMKYPVQKVVVSGETFKPLSIEGIWVQIEPDLYVSKHFLKEISTDSDEYVQVSQNQKL